MARSKRSSRRQSRPKSEARSSLGASRSRQSSQSTTPSPSTPREIRRRTGSRTGGVFPRITNVVATYNVDSRLELQYIADNCRNAVYRPSRFSGAIVKILEPKTTALMFKSGKMVVTGARTEADSRLACRKFVRILQKIGFSAKWNSLEYRVVNLVGSASVGFPIQLEGIHYRHREFATYEPELFPSCVYRMERPRGTFLLFASGKVIMLGFREEEDVYTAFDLLYPVLQQFRKYFAVEGKAADGRL